MQPTAPTRLACRALVSTFVAALSMTVLTACDRNPSDPPRPTTDERLNDTNRAPATNPATPVPPGQSPATPGPSSGTGTQ